MQAEISVPSIIQLDIFVKTLYHYIGHNEGNFIRLFLFILTSGVTLLFYQNCGKSFDTLKKTDLNSLDSSSLNNGSTNNPPPSANQPNLPPTNNIPPANNPNQQILLMKEDFETTALSTSTWKWIHETATYTIDTGRFHRGRSSLKITTSNINKNPWNHGIIETIRPFPLGNKSLFMRAFVFLDTPLPDRHFTVITAKSSEKPPTTGTWDYKINVLPSGSSVLWRYLWTYGNVGNGQFLDSSSADGPQGGRWACWEWELDGANRELNFWYDNTAVPNFSAKIESQWAIPKNINVQFGFRTSHRESYGDTGYTLWLDDIAINDKRIGCAD